MYEITASNSLADDAAQTVAEREQTSDQPKTWEAYAHEVCVAWRKAVASIIETGLILLEAKEGPYRLRHGAFEAMVRTKLPFAASTARKLMAIARHPVLSNRSHVNVLPPSYATLYALTKVPDERLIAFIKDGTINPNLEREDVVALRGDQSPQPAKPVSSGLREENAQLKAELRRLHDQVDDIFDPNDTVVALARVIVEQMRRLSNDKADKVLQEAKKQIKLRPIREAAS